MYHLCNEFNFLNVNGIINKRHGVFMIPRTDQK